MWRRGNLDPHTKILIPETENKIYKTIAHVAGSSSVRNQDLIIQMWDHRDHLHANVVSK